MIFMVSTEDPDRKSTECRASLTISTFDPSFVQVKFWLGIPVALQVKVAELPTLRKCILGSTPENQVEHQLKGHDNNSTLLSVTTTHVFK